MTRPRLLDLFCGAGGASGPPDRSSGYAKYFDCVGVDIAPQPHYPFECHRADALDTLKCLSHGWEVDGYRLADFDAIHASPPCQAFTRARSIQGRGHPDLLTPTRDLLNATGLPWVIENVPGAPMRSDLILCGTQFGLATRRHRVFEFSMCPALLVAPCANHHAAPVQVFGNGGGVKKPGDHGDRWSRQERRDAMGIHWMSNRELSQAIPPAYTEFIGAQLLAYVKAAL